jgi:hypothetical protein
MQKSTREETVLLTTAQYLALLRAEASVKAAESRVQLSERLAKQAHDLLSSGVATNIDVSRAEVRVLTEKQALVDAQSEIELSRSTSAPKSLRETCWTKGSESAVSRKSAASSFPRMCVRSRAHSI